ncbi:hypothetical protein YC2023_099193 [Brassica napus]
MKCDKIGAAPCEGCLHTLVEGVKPFVVRLGVKILTTYVRDQFARFRARPRPNNVFRVCDDYFGLRYPESF